MNKEKKQILKKRNWALIGYPESLPDNFIDLIINTGVPAVISPLHDKDINELTGELKKPHYHIILCYSGPTTLNSVKNISDMLKSPIPIPLESIKGAYRYLTHKDNPEKAQYNENEIIHLNGFNKIDFLEYTKSEINILKFDVIAFIEDHDINEYRDLIWLIGNQNDELINIVVNNTIFFKYYLDSRRHTFTTRNKDDDFILKLRK